jgi:acyl-CoA reductase-like NAD-dependent aldehyde dehydrogenase
MTITDHATAPAASADSTFASFDPKTGNEIARYPNTSAADVDAAVTRAHEAAIMWHNLGAARRKSVLKSWATMLTKRIDDLASVIALETGKPISDATLEATLAIGHLSWAASNAQKVLAASRRPSGLLMFNMSSRVERVPLGVVGVIGPWNYPVFTPMGSIAYALAAGNAVVFKPSEFTPGVAIFLQNTFDEISPIDNLFTVVTGLPDTGRALTQSAVNKLSFTGSTRTAKKVAASCGERMIPVVLECGGKDPVIVASDANVKKAAEYALWSAMSNAGQTCIGAERVYVLEDVADQFIAEITAMAKSISAGPSGNYGPATMPSQLGVIASHINDAKSHGAKFIVGGPESVTDRYVQPVIMLDVDQSSTAITEETFGPTLTINRVATIHEAISLANASSYGLAASVWSKRNGRKIASRLHAGMVSINSVIAFAAIAAVPFGGVKDSGYGRIHGPEGLLEFTYPRTIVKQLFAIPIAFTTFKRTKFADAFIKRAVKLLHSKGLG